MDQRGAPFPQELLQKYRVEWKVGSGTFGVVYKAYSRQSQYKQVVAIKQFKAHKGDLSEGVSVTACREIMVRRTYKVSESPSLNKMVQTSF